MRREVVRWWFWSLCLLATEGQDFTYGDFQTVNKCCGISERYEVAKGCVPTQTLNNTMTLFENETGKFLETAAKNTTGQTQRNSSDEPIIFRIVVRQPKCSNGIIEKTIHKENLVNESYDDASSVYLSTNGSLFRFDEEGFIQTHDHADFCIDHVNKTTYVAVICKPQCDAEVPCVRKCCGLESVFDGENCVEVNRPWNPFLYLTPSDLAKVDHHGSHYVVGFPRCKEFYALKYVESKLFTLLNGSLVAIDQKDNNKRLVFSRDIFCIDGLGVKNSNNESELEGTYSGEEKDQVALICYPEDEDEEDMWLYPLYATAMFISSFFLLLTALVYLILWEFQNIHGWLQFFYVTALLCAFISLAVLQLPDMSGKVQDWNMELCQFMGSLIHFSFLSAFFWLTSMNFDLWWTFSGCQPLRAGSRSGEKFRFTLFSLFSLGIPFLIAGTGFALDTIYRDSDSQIVRPRYGEKRCYLYGEKEQLPYFYIPVGTLLIINVVFFLSTIYSLRKIQNDTKFATRQSSKQDKKKFILFMKLFVVMGVLWIFEVISWFVINFYPGEEKFIKRLFIVTDLINALQGLAIFVIFICKPNTCKQLEGQFKKFTLFLEEKRESYNGGGVSLGGRSCGCFLVLFCTLVLPVCHLLRQLFSFCGRPTRSLAGRRKSQNHTTTSTFDKSVTRKASDCSVSTTFSVVDPGAYELDQTLGSFNRIQKNS